MERKPLIYLASPYTHELPEVMQLRYEIAQEVVTDMLKAGVHVFSPIVYGHQFADEIGADYLTWQSFNDRMLAACDWFVMLVIDGWKDSKGIQDEFEKAFDKHIEYLHQDNLDEFIARYHDKD